MDYFNYDFDQQRPGWLGPTAGWVLTGISYLSGILAVFWGPLTFLVIGLVFGWAGRILTGRPTYYGWIVGLGFVVGTGSVVWTRWIS